MHGFVDYFFQTHLADFFVERGWDFYALDLRKYGRSLLPHQTPNFCRDLSDYFPELDEAVEIIREEDGHDDAAGQRPLHRRPDHRAVGARARDDGLIDGLFLNSPFFDFNAPWLRAPARSRPPSPGWAAGAPYRIVPIGHARRCTARACTPSHRGEWTYDLTWKPLDGFPVRAGWLAAIRRGQRRLHAGLAIAVPVLVACSTRTLPRRSLATTAALGRRGARRRAHRPLGAAARPARHARPVRRRHARSDPVRAGRTRPGPQRAGPLGRRVRRAGRAGPDPDREVPLPRQA